MAELGEEIDLASLPSKLGNYRILEEIGRGGMGIVFRAIDEKLNREVALKVVLDGRLAGKESISRFLQEAHAAAKLDHPAIAPVYETGEDQGFVFYSSRLMDGGSLADYVSKKARDHGPNDQEQRVCLRMLQHLAQGLHYGHQHGIIHRDIKPGNILLSEDGDSCIADFGLAKNLAVGASNITLTGLTVGSPAYMAPEQIEGRGISQAVDIYALGAVLFELLTGRPPFSGNTVASIYRDIGSKDVVFPDSNIHQSLRAICLKCLHKKPEHRYPSAAAFAEDIQRYLHDLPIIARHISPPERLLLWCRRRPMIAGLGFVTLLAAMLAIYSSVSNYQLQSESHINAQRAQLEAEIQERISRHLLAQEIMIRANDLCRQHGASNNAALYLQAAEHSWDDVETKHEALEIFSAWTASLPEIIRHSDDGFTSVAFSNQGKIATYGPDSQCRIHRPRLPPITLSHSSRVSRAVFSPSGKVIAVYAEPDVYLYRVADGSLIHRFNKSGPIAFPSNPLIDGAAIAFHPDGTQLTVAYPAESTITYNLSDYKIASTLPSPSGDPILRQALKLIYSELGSHLVILYHGGCRVANLLTGENYFIKAGIAFNDLAIDRSNRWIALADADHRVKIYNLENGTLTSEAEHRYKVSALSFSPDGTHLASGSRDRSAMLFTIDQHGVLKQKQLYRHPAAVIDILWHLDGASLATLCEDGRIRTFGLHSARVQQNIPSEVQKPWAFQLRKTDTLSRIYTQGAQGSISSIEFPHPHPPVRNLQKQVHIMRVIEGNAGLMTASNYPDDQCVLQAHTFQGQLLGVKNKSLHNSGINPKAFSLSKDGLLATSSTSPSRIRVWRSMDGSLAFDHHVSDEVCLATAVCDRWLASVDRTCRLRIHNLKTGKLHASYLLPKPVLKLRFDPTGSMLACAVSDRLMCFEITPVAGARLLHQKSRHDNQILCLEFSPCGGILASGGMDHIARLWDARTGNPIGQPMAHPDYVWELAFNEDGKLLATGGQFSSIYYWHTRSALQCGPPVPQSAWINALAFHREKDRKELLFVAGSDFWLRKIPLPKIHKSVRIGDVTSTGLSHRQQTARQSQAPEQE